MTTQRFTTWVDADSVKHIKPIGAAETVCGKRTYRTAKGKLGASFVCSRCQGLAQDVIAEADAHARRSARR